ncbi:MAG: hypothetical protein ACD_80C00011G0003 [uncultured bacterium (gcode 4)]|uniref:Uncharacterized protein n=1 Tax=uncultured bacterium (gcode 4) TaxID=1234023 RepID=K1XK89_9BACT|nr:MAG: hypothetical protein ACD_80C00011G0003 [uncultured bacterium (gcode 4)]
MTKEYLQWIDENGCLVQKIKITKLISNIYHDFGRDFLLNF